MAPSPPPSKPKTASTENSSSSPPKKKQPHFSMVREFALADFITLCNGVCGTVSIFCSASFLKTNDTSFLWTAVGALPLGFLFDALDGNVARWRKQESLLGQELDSLADLVSFSVAPAMLAFAAGMDSAADCAILTYFICCGIARLARYNATVELIKKQTGKAKITHFEGTPVPTTLLLDVIVAWFLSKGWIADALPYGVVELGAWPGVGGVIIHPIVLMYGLSGTLQISKSLRVPKPFS
ncbi:CDP-diacylglycerol-serine O-phosphatidyltransferase [Gonapodya prolifera JEL478]|uniref:CDP-diacylglycerol--serine O-phosphatidyltransferase n=1 Tax=Gonapodya prolifera (strain JEL478) TaxID=1344416 RepID=A0A139A6K2_GONPJ|nr:CDP-diacylglycerol-serine O-phosphatidyltransferase [Gonapodya prolifera JEL478]|eukprot:KXS12450.1 CDP-diacylglycerol-serine O-phosphatidyltransferase [Gonapodya prolifera JEL478]